MGREPFKLVPFVRLEWKFALVIFVEVISVAENSGVNQSKNVLIKIWEFHHSSFLGSVPSQPTGGYKAEKSNG